MLNLANLIIITREGKSLKYYRVNMLLFLEIKIVS